MTPKSFSSLAIFLFVVALVASAGSLATAKPGPFDLLTEPMKLFKEPAKLLAEPTKLLTDPAKLLKDSTKLITEPLKLMTGTAKSVSDSVQDPSGGGGGYNKDKEQGVKPAKLFGSLAKSFQSMLEKLSGGGGGAGGAEGLAKLFPFGKALGSLIGHRSGARSLQLTPPLVDGPQAAAAATALKAISGGNKTTAAEQPINKPLAKPLPGILANLVAKNPALEKWAKNFIKYFDLSKVAGNFGQVLKKDAGGEGGGSGGAYGASNSTSGYSLDKINSKLKDGLNSITKGQGAGGSGGPLGLVSGMLNY